MSAATEQVSAAIRQEMDWQSLTSAAVARLSGISYRTFQRRLHGASPWFLNEVQAVADTLGVNVYELFRRAEAQA